jgi:flavin-dependent dehydrogenase
MKTDCDLLVIGGGPGGSTIAALAAQRGVNVKVIERAKFPRNKVCGEFLSAEGCRIVERLGLLDELTSRGCVWMGACRITDTGGARLDADLPDLGPSGRDGLGVSRELLDPLLLEHARRGGAEILMRHDAHEPMIDRGKVRGFRVRPVGEPASGTEIRARLVVAADGRRSVLARRLHPQLCDPQASSASSWFGLKVHLKTETDRLQGRVELHLFDGGYAGLGAVEGGRVNLALLATVRALRDCGGSPDRLLEERVMLNEAARFAIGDGTRCGRWHSVGPLSWGARRPAAAGALFVGDAAGTIDPFCGEGMSNAMRSAEIALPLVLRAVERGQADAEICRAYTDEWFQAFGPVTRRVRRVGRLFERPRLAAPVLRFLTGVAAPWIPRLIASTRTARAR